MTLQINNAQMSKKDFMLIGMKKTAYIKPMRVEGREIYIIHAADGSLLTAVTNKEIAIITIRQNHMTPSSLH